MATEEPLPAARRHPSEIRISRGATAMGTDGALGTVHQIIMDQRTGELQALVLTTSDARRLELPASHVLQATGGTVYVDVSQSDLRLHPELAPPYNPNRYIPVSAQPAPEPSAGQSDTDTTAATERPVVTSVERDAIAVVVPGAGDARETPADIHPAPITTPLADMQHPDMAVASSGPEIAATDPGTERPVENDEEATRMEGSNPTVNPMNPGATSGGIHDDVGGVANMLDESQRGYTHPAPPEAGERAWERQRVMSMSFSGGDGGGSQLSWVPAAALGALIVGIGVWTTLRALRRGRRRATKAARKAAVKARANVRGSMRDAGKSAAALAQTMRASALEVAANPRDTASDAFSNFADIPARYRWFRRGIRVGAQAARFQRR